ncbi:WD40 repeat-like protein [Irpex rosettiformis]|uniref:WD40 repeat-like protein n=1 Tax=Irpex rosettiformis TaxID=378272 RepID=A0ACB8U3X9_9APHY|nr:WD40 repeat-like protein [Irpex rosettiformis]
MPDIPVSSQIFDIAFDQTRQIVHGALLSGSIQSFSYGDEDAHFKYEKKLNMRLSKKSCRSLDVSEDGERLWVVGKSKSLYTVDTSTGTLTSTRKVVHDAAINRIKRLTPNLLSTGDDDGVVKLWDPRKPDPVNTYTHHFDFISDFLWLEDKKHLVCTSGDGTLSVLDVRSKKDKPFAQSEDQEDELLSIVAIKGGSKLLIGTQSGALTLFSPRHGYADCVTRIPGHPHSIDTLSSIPSRYPNSSCTVLTGSSDGLVRVVEVFPQSKLIGVLTDSEGWPVERVRVDLGGEGRWAGCVGHEEVLRLVDLKEVFEDGDGDNDSEEDDNDDNGEEGEDEGEEGVEKGANKKKASNEGPVEDWDPENDDSTDVPPPNLDAEAGDSDSDVPTKERKRKKKQEKDIFRTSKKGRGRNELEVGDGFFADL